MDAKVGRNARCPCGSGRKFKQCCGATSRGAPVADARSILARAVMELQRGDAAGAATSCRRVIDAQPKFAHAHYLLGLAQRALGDLASSARSIERALELGLADAAAHYQYAQVLLDLGRVEPAIAQLERAVALKPDFVEAHGDLGNIHYECGRYEAAEASYRRAVDFSAGEDWVPHHNLAHALAALQRNDEAHEVIDKVVALAPDRAEPHGMKAMLYELDHRLDEARRSAERAMALDPANGSGLTVLAKLERRKGDFDAALKLLERADPARMSEIQKVTWYSERGRAFDRLQRYAEAFQSFAQSGAALGRYRRVTYDAAPEEAAMDRIEAWFSNRAAAHRLPAADDRGDAPQPIFVLGFLRSGTTLVEQILGSHDDIAPLGELALVEDCLAALNDELGDTFPDGLDALENEALLGLLNRLRDRYLQGARALLDPTGTRKWFVDKAPLNSRHIGLIRLMFPKAPILHVVRHPLDTVLSCYFENFFAVHAWSYSLDDAARLYARVHAHMKAMSELVPKRPIQLRYERLVAEPEKEVRGLLSLLGVDWDPKCLKFYESERRARTASYEQVTRPIYSSSVDRYRHYLPFIEPDAIAALEPAIDELGYSLMTAG